MDIRTLGIDLAKNLFRVHGTDEKGETIVQRQLRRRQLLPFMAQLPSCLVGMEACGLMTLARSTYYYRGRRANPVRKAIERRIEQLCAEFPRYGYRRITAQLRNEGTTINHKAMARLMRERQLQVRPLKRFMRTTQSDHDSPIFPDFLPCDKGLVPESVFGLRNLQHQ